MSILSGIIKHKRYIADDNGDKTIVSEWTSTDTVDVSQDIENKDHTKAEATAWDDTYDETDTQPESMNDLVTKLTATFSNTKYLKNQVEELLDTISRINHPVGSYYWSSVNTDPATLFGGTWVRVTDKFILAAGSTYSAGAKGGQAKVSYKPAGTISSTRLTTDHLPQHNHSIPALSGTAASGGAHVHSYWLPNLQPSNAGEGNLGRTSDATYTKYKTGNYEGTGANEGAHTHTVTTETGKSTGNAGKATPSAHTHTFTGTSANINTMPPYEVAYCWKRTA